MPRPRAVSSKEFQNLAVILIGCVGRGVGSPTFLRRFKATFGVPPKVVAASWRLIILNDSLNHLGPRSVRPLHLLWALMYLKGYATEADHAGRAGCCEKTFRKWTWFYVECFADLDAKLIRWENRFKGDKGNRCLVSVDGTDFRIGEPVPFQKVWYTKKFHGPGLRYELAVNIVTGDIVWFNGPFAPKTNPDITIFRWGLRRMLGDGEMVVCDRGYRGDTRAYTPYSYQAKNKHHQQAMSLVRARHETVNRRLKVWKALRNGFRHHRSKHHLVFRAVVILTQIMFNHGYRPFALKDFTYSDPLWLSWL